MDGCARSITMKQLKSVNILQREEVFHGSNMLANFHEHAPIFAAHLP